LIPAGLNDNRSDGSGSERGIDLAVVVLPYRLSGKSALANGFGLLGVGTGAGA
jgi:hypothetical protein